MSRKGKKKVDMKGQRALSTLRQYFPGVTAVSDATRGAEIEVTVPDSKNSISLDHARCALAVACKRSFKADGVLVGTKTCYVIHGHNAVRYKLPESTSREIVSFDRKAGFYPGRYSLRAPGPQERFGSAQSGRTHNYSGFKKPRFHHMTGGIRTILGHKTDTETETEVTAGEF